MDGHVVDPDKLDANPFIQQVMADVEQIAANEPPPPERFSVIETEGGYTELKALLDEDEYAAARESTLTAFYTPPVVIRSIYQALENMGFKTGNLLEPSCGIGNFIGMRPETLADSKIYGVELDGISGRIARQLYQKSSIAVQGFEKTDLPDSFFDAAIGNVPFGSFKVSDA